MPLPICNEPGYKSQLEHFLSDWPLSRVRTMPLTDYARVRSDSDEKAYKGSFCYALEQLTPVGIGGANALKFAIYECKKTPKVKKAKYDGRYAWQEDLGDTAEEAFAQVRDMIIKTIEAAQSGNYSLLDGIPLRRTLKWKIAFLYQSPAKPGIVGCVSEQGIKDYFEGKGVDVDNTPVSELHQMAIEQASDQPSIQKIGGLIWDSVNEQVEEEQEEDGDEDGDEEAAEDERAVWLYGAGLGDKSGGVTDIYTILRTNEIRINLDIMGPLDAVSTDKAEGKTDVLRILLKGDEAAVQQALNNTYNFHHMGIPNGAVLVFVHDETKTAVVTGAREIKFEGESTSISAVTNKLQNKVTYPSVMRAWKYNGKTLKEYQRAKAPQPPKITALMAWHFAKSMKVGDVVLARKAGTVEYIGGIITSDYIFDANRPNFRHARKVRWLNAEPIDIGAGLGRVSKKLITRAMYRDGTPWAEALEIADMLKIDMDNLPEITPVQLPAASKNPSMIKPTNVILYGPPGTGKTYRTRGHALKTCLNLPEDTEEAKAKDQFSKLIESKQVAFVTFHQSYDYSDFIIGFKPVTRGNGAMGFEVRKGLLMRIAEEAANNPAESYLLIIDEINRGNVSKIFGELITLIEADKRAGGDFEVEVTLPCAYVGADGKETNQFTLPSNLHFLGTMNTADRSIALLDTALRRRFEFKNTPPDPSKLSADLGGVNLRNLLTNLNKTLKDKFDADHQVGHAWFPLDGKKGATIEKVIEAFNNKILPLLDEWFYDDEKGKLELVSQFTEGGKVTQKSLEKYSAKLA